MKTQVLKDTEWLRRTFMVPIKEATHEYDIKEVLNGAAFKYTDTTPGGSFAINPPPQFTAFADRPVIGKLVPKGRYGGEMGRYYSEALDDNGTYVHMRFGVPQFNSLGNFFMNAYSHEASLLARTGRGSSAFYSAGKTLGFVITLPFQPIVWANKVYRFLAGKPASRYYYLKPAMPLYWNAVASMVNAIGVNMGQIGRAMSEGESQLRTDEEKWDGGSMGKYHELLPEVYREDGGIDVYAMATRAQRMAHIHHERMGNLLSEAGSLEQLGQSIRRYRDEEMPEATGRSLEEATASYHAAQANTSAGYLDKSKPEDPSAMNTNEENAIGNEFEEIAEPTLMDYMEAEGEDGAAFVTFRVNNPGPVSETFSNETEESELSSKINSMSASARSTRFTFAEGNLGGNFVADAIQGIAGAVTKFVQGVGDGLGISGLNILAGAAYIDIPKVWSGSTANLPTAEYTIELRSPYGNPMSRLQNLYIPLAMILAGALPLATGKQSYTSPFLCELYSKGRNQTRLGMIESLSITRGVGNLGFNQNKEPLGIDVTFSVIDLSSVMAMPVNTDIKLGEIGANLVGNFDDDNTYTDYMAVLGGLGLVDQIYPLNKLAIRRAQTMANWEQWKSPAHHANWLMGSTPGRILHMFMAQTKRAG